ncbi:MAG: aspartate aminotransferase family protein [Hyphomicrobiaceae bacterium]|nr:aspartate aminotransferase family protein [Hyphomicrobiaceae bacterium]
MAIPNSPEARDVAFHFHGYTNAKKHLDTGPMVISRGDGVFVFDENGNRYLEAMSGLWSVGLGFSEQRLIAAATKQLNTLPYYHNFSHKSHKPAIELAEKLISLSPVSMSKIFYTNSGSEANDTILKMVWYRANAMGTPKKKKVISRLRGYHGVTLASASLTGLPANHQSFDLPIANVLHTICPHYRKEGRSGESEEQFASRCAEALEALILAEGAETIGAFFAEPIMGAGGVIVPPATYWSKIQAVLSKFDILLVADEVICGFGRTGKMFGSETFGITPDIIVMSKQITSSYFPLSAIMINDRVFEPIAQESGRLGVLGHGFTGGAHPVGAAIAAENIKIIEERDLISHVAEVGAQLMKGLLAFESHPLVTEARGRGLLAALELGASDDEKFSPGTLGTKMNEILTGNGVISRNMVDAMALCPPMIITPSEVDHILDVFEKSLSELQIFGAAL